MITLLSRLGDTDRLSSICHIAHSIASWLFLNHHRSIYNPPYCARRSKRLPNTGISIFMVVLLISMVSTRARASSNLDSALVAYWSFDGNAFDLSGIGNHGIVYGARLVQDRFGAAQRAYLFDGVNDYIDCGNGLNDLDVPFSICAWIKLEDYDPGGAWAEPIISSDDQQSDCCNYRGFWLSISDDVWGPASRVLAISYGDGTGAGKSDRRTKFGSVQIPFHEWVHVAAVVRGPTDMSLYINAQEDTLAYYAGWGGQMVHNEWPITIGMRGRYGPYYFNGVINEVMVYNRALSAEEIQEIYSGHTIPNIRYGELAGSITSGTHLTPGASINLSNSFYGMSDADGSFSISNIPAGQYTLLAYKDGYLPYQTSVIIYPDSTVIHNIQLTGLPPDIQYIGHRSFSGKEAEGEPDYKISAGDHAHLILHFKNYGAYATNIPIHISNLNPSDIPEYQATLKFSQTGSSGWADQIDLTIPEIHGGAVTTLDLYIYVNRIDPDYLGDRVIPDNPRFVISSGTGAVDTIEVVLERVDFSASCPADEAKFIQGDCLAHPTDPKIMQFAQYACGNDSRGNPNADPDNVIHASTNLAATVRNEFLPDDNTVNIIVGGLAEAVLVRPSDVELLKRRWDSSMVCRHYTDLCTGLLRSIGVPVRRVFANYPPFTAGLFASHVWNEYFSSGTWYYLDATWRNYEPLSATKCDVQYENNYPWDVRAEATTISQMSPMHPYFNWPGPVEDMLCTLCSCSNDYENVTYSYNQNCMTRYIGSHHAQGITDNELTLNMHTQRYQYIDSLLIVKCVVINNDSVPHNNIQLAIVPLDSLETVFTRLDTIELIDNLQPSSIDTVSFRIIPHTPGTWPIIALATYDEQVLYVNDWVQFMLAGDPPRLIVNGFLSTNEIHPGEEMVIKAAVTDTSFTNLTLLDECKAVIRAVNESGYADSLYLTYSDQDSSFTASYTIPADAPEGRYRVKWSVSKIGFVSDTTRAGFVVIPSLRIDAYSVDSSYSVDDTIAIYASVLDRQSLVDNASIMANVFSDTIKLASFQMANTTNGIYRLSLIPRRIAMANAKIDSISRTWRIICEADYAGARARDSIDVFIDMPNVAITSLSYAPDEPFDDEYLTLTIGVKNIGTATSDSTIIRVYDGQIADSCLIGGNLKIRELAPGEEQFLSLYVYLGGMQGDHTLIAVLDKDRAIVDSNRLNNQISKYLHVFGRVTGLHDHGGRGSEPPKSFALLQNYPNPFNPSTTIRFDIPKQTSVRLDIYSVTGALVRNLISEKLSANRYSITWDGRDKNGNIVASGVYFLRLKAGTKVLVKKIVLLK